MIKLSSWLLRIDSYAVRILGGINTDSVIILMPEPPVRENNPHDQRSQSENIEQFISGVSDQLGECFTDSFQTVTG